MGRHVIVAPDARGYRITLKSDEPVSRQEALNRILAALREGLVIEEAAGTIRISR